MGADESNFFFFWSSELLVLNFEDVEQKVFHCRNICLKIKLQNFLALVSWAPLGSFPFALNKCLCSYLGERHNLRN